MVLARCAVGCLLAATLSGCTVGTVTTPSHFGGYGQFDFLAAGQQPIPTTGGTIAVPYPDRPTGPGAERGAATAGRL